MRRGDIVTASIRGDYGKPRPAVIIQSDIFDQTASVTVLLVTGTLQDASLVRLDIEPTDSNGLRKPSQVMIDRLMTVPRNRVGPVIGHVSDRQIVSTNRHLAAFLGLV